MKAANRLSNALRAGVRDWLNTGPIPPALTAMERERATWSDGRKALELVFTQSTWTHRRAETYSLESNGETRQRLSWDFTLEPTLAIPASRGRTALPLATMRKQPLKRLDVVDAGGTALSIWGKDDNGRLAKEALASLLTGLLGRDLSDHELFTLNAIVFAKDATDAYPHLKRLERYLLNTGDSGESLLALAQDLAANFLLVVEVPNECVGTRSLVKLKHEGDIGEDEGYSALSTVHKSRFEGAAWSSAASWHVEIHAPPGLAIAALTSEVSDSDDEDIRTLARSPVVGHTAHISGQTTPLGSLAFADLELRPATAGLVNQTLAGAVVAWLLLSAGLIWHDRLFIAVNDPNRGSAVAAVMLAIPAFLIAVLSRGPEHRLVSRLLLVPRLVNLAVATVLLATAAALVLGLTPEAMHWTLAGLWIAQAVLLIAAVGVRNRSVGGRP